MGSLFSSEEYQPEKHGLATRALFDEYVASPDKFKDLTGQVVAITGTSAGSIGFHVAEIAIRKNAKLLMLCNRPSTSSQKGTEELKALAKDCNSPTDIQAVTCDLQDLESVCQASDEINAIAAKHQGLDVLICNAGVMAVKDTRTKDGFDVQMQTNQLSHFLLISKVWKSIVQASKSRGHARVITHSSSARSGGDLEQDYFQKSAPGSLGGECYILWQLLFGYRGEWIRYHQTKLANANFSMALHDKLQAKVLADSKIFSSSADPGLASSNLQATTVADGGMPNWMTKMLMKGGQSSADGALPVSMAAFGQSTKSGSFFVPEQQALGPPMATIVEGVPVKPHTETVVVSSQNKENVWKWCEEALDIQFEI